MEPKRISRKQQLKLVKRFPAYLKSKKPALINNYGKENAERITLIARHAYPEIAASVPTFNSSMYDSLVVVASELAALKKGMRAAGVATEEFVRFNIEQTRLKSQKLPLSVRRLLGKIYLSRLVRIYLKGVAKTVTKYGWPTRLTDGTRQDDFTMSLETRDCQMVKFFETVGEGDIKPYCTFFDFASAEALGIGLKQVSDIDSGVCKYCFYKKGEVEWPERIKEILNN